MNTMCRGVDFGESTETYHGLYPGKVSVAVDSENKCRIKVALPWISDTYVSNWAPVAQLYAGSGYGGYWVPEENDQVVVAFLQGDLRRPIILGSLYSSVREPHATRSSSLDPKYFRTKGGHMLLMEDAEGKRIELVDSSGNNSIVIDTETNSMTIKADADITINAGGSLTLNAAEDITINANGKVTVSGATINLN